jgi:hypothetical protein
LLEIVEIVRAFLAKLELERGEYVGIAWESAEFPPLVNSVRRL